MQFDSALYLWFLVLVWLGVWATLKVPALRLAILLLASWAFYASWSWPFLGLILFSTVVDYACGALIHRTDNATQRTLWLVVSLVTNLGLLGIFKYLGFFTQSLDAALTAFHSGVSVPVVALVLPVGISFYTFQTLSYTIDIYRGRLEPARSFWHFALFVSFFPQLVAGPIVRARDLLPQLARRPAFDADDQARGLFRILTGLIKKVAIADVLATELVDRVYETPDLYGSTESIIAIYAYSLQIYADFSAYSDIAIGSAMLLGYSLPENFDRPYTAASLQDFWRRWHISLSTWLRDYLYIPLGGNRHGAVRTYLNLMITMLLGGLWHGASWTFVFWGLLHGGGLAVNRMWQRWRERRFPGHTWGPVMHGVMTLLTLHFVVFAFHWFRAPDFTRGVEVLERVASLELAAPNLGWPVLAALGFGIVLHATPRDWKAGLQSGWRRVPAVLQATVLVGVLVVLQQIKASGGRPFIYFQF